MDYLRDSLEKDKYLSISAMYLGCLLTESLQFKEAIRAFETVLKGMRNCKFIDYKAIGLPFRLNRKEVDFNLASLNKQVYGIMSDEFLRCLAALDIEDLKRLLLPNDAILLLKRPPFNNPKMYFDLIAGRRVKSIELRGPEFVGLIEGEVYNSGFEAATQRTVIKRIILAAFNCPLCREN